MLHNARGRGEWLDCLEAQRVISGGRQLENHRGVLHYEVNGQGPCVVLCHAMATDASLWSSAVRALEESFKVVAFDLRGHGRSSAARDNDYSFEAMARDVLDLLDHLGVSQASVVGISVGGEVAQVFAATYPERVQKLLLCSTACVTTPARAMIWRDRIAEVESRGLAAIASSSVVRWFSPSFRARNADVVERFRDRLAAMDPHVYGAIARTIQQMDLRALIGGLKCNTLVVCGDADGNTGPEVASVIVENITGSEFTVIEGVAHFPNLEAPEIFERLMLDWLSTPPAHPSRP